MNISLVVPKTIFVRSCRLIIGLLLLGNCGINAQTETSDTDWQQRIDRIEQWSGKTPWQWATNLTYQWFDLGSSQNRIANKTTTSPNTRRLATPITTSYRLRKNHLTLGADFGRMLHTEIEANKQPFTGHMEPAGFDTLTTYSYASIPDQTKILCEWEIAGIKYLGQLEALEDLVLWMNKWNPSGQWRLDPDNLQIEGQLDENDCGALEISALNDKTTIKIDPVVQYQPIGTILHLEEGTRVLSFQEPGNPETESLVFETPLSHVNPQATNYSPISPVVVFVQQPNKSFLLVQNLEKMPEHRLSVFNRWGKEIFHAIKYQNNWEGKSQEHIVPEGTYYYVLDNGKGETYTGCFNIRS